MKNIVFSLLAAFCICSVQAQSIADYFKEHPLKSNGAASDLAILSLTPELQIIRQQYRLERNGEYFGKNDMAFFGESYSLAIKVSGGTIMQNRVIAPYLGDADYERINKTGKYKPAWFWSYQKGIKDSTFVSASLELGTEFVQPADKDSMLYLHTDSYSDFGLVIDESAGKKSGYMVWAYANPNAQDSTMTASLKQSSFALTASADSACISMSPSEPERVIGGLFVVPKYERAGRVQFMLVGVASKNSKGEWKLILLTTKNIQRNGSKDVSSEGDADVELTPSKAQSPIPSKDKKNKDKKQKK